MEQVKDSLSTIDFSYIVLKIEKLTAALHLVTSFLNNSDPIKYKLRDKALELMQASLPLKHGSLSYKTAVTDDLKKGIGTITSFISVALTDGAVSQMNLTILQKEYNDLYKYLDQYQPSKESLVGVVAEPQVSFLAEPVLGYQVSARNYQQKTASEGRERPEKTTSDREVSGSQNTERKTQIIGFITNNGWSAINEIAKAVPGVSSKTIQRELVNLVNEGLLTKKGDRRWSRYTLASNG